MSDDNTYLTNLYLEDQAPHIGCGWHMVEVREGEKWAYLTSTTKSRRKQKIRIEVFDEIEQRPII